MTGKTRRPKSYGMQQKQFYEGSNSISTQETRKISNKQSNPTLKTTRERRTKKTQRLNKNNNNRNNKNNNSNKNFKIKKKNKTEPTTGGIKT